MKEETKRVQLSVAWSNPQPVCRPPCSNAEIHLLHPLRHCHLVLIKGESAEGNEDPRYKQSTQELKTDSQLRQLPIADLLRLQTFEDLTGVANRTALASIAYLDPRQSLSLHSLSLESPQHPDKNAVDNPQIVLKDQDPLDS